MEEIVEEKVKKKKNDWRNRYRVVKMRNMWKNV